MHVTKNIGLRIVQLVLQVAITLLIARLARAEGNGYFSLFITETSLLALILGLSADSGIIYFTGKGKTDLSQITTFICSILFVQVIAGVLIYYAISATTGYHFFTLQGGTSYASLGFLYILSVVLTNYYTGYNNSLGRFNTIIIYNIVIYLVLFALLAWGSYSEFSSISRYLCLPFMVALYVWASVLYAVFLIAYTYINNKEPLRFNDFTLWYNKPFRLYVFNVFIGNVVQFLAYRMDIWFVNYYDTKQDVGNYALASKIAQFWLILPQFISALIFPVTASGNTYKYNFKRVALYIILFNIVAAIVAMVAYPLFIYYFMKDDYGESYRPFLWLLPGVIVFSLNTLLAAHLAGIGHVKINRQGSVLCFVVILVLDIVLIPRYSIIGAAMASSVGYIASTIFVLIKYFNLKDEGPVAGNVVP